MLKKNFLIITMLTVFLGAFAMINAQENPGEKIEARKVMQYDDMQICMNKIAADSTMRMQMMGRMMEQCKGDDKAMMQMCKKMMDNPEMHKTMMKMMHGEGRMKGEMMKDGMMNKDMIYDSTRAMQKLKTTGDE